MQWRNSPHAPSRNAWVYTGAMLSEQTIQCPYCGERIEILVDASAGDQGYIEDCQVCCRPISIDVWLDADDNPHVSATGEDDA